MDVSFSDQVQVWLTFAILPIMLASHGRRMDQERKERGKLGTVKKLVMLAFIIEIISAFSNFVFMLNWLPKEAPWRVVSSDDGLAINTLPTGLIVTLGLSFVIYMFRIERLQYTPLYAFGGMVFYYFASGGHSELFPIYIYAGGISALLLMYIASFKLKDNYALGLAIFYTFSFLDLIVGVLGVADADIINVVITIVTYGFGLFYATGKFRPFDRAIKPRATTGTIMVQEAKKE